MNTLSKISGPRDRQRGLSLVELMIALTVGVILLAGVVSIFISSRRSYSTNNAVSQLQENGRFAMDFITHDTRLAGYMGCAKSITIDNMLSSGSLSSFAFDFNDPVTGYESTGSAPGNGIALAANPAAGSGVYTANAAGYPIDPVISGKAIAGSDVLGIRSSISTPIYVTQIPASSAANFKVVSVAGIQTGQLGIVTDCVKGTLFQVTNLVSSSNTVVHSIGSYTPGNSSPNFSESYVGSAMFLQPDTIAFYIAPGADGSPALWKADLQLSGTNVQLTPQELVSGVENMQVLYGIDTTGIQTPSQYVTANQVTNWNQVISIRVGLLLQSNPGAVAQATVPPASTPCAAGTYNVLGTCVSAPQDTRLRRVFTATIGLRTLLP
ncbi:MAG: PilW family protein [Gammaproteobacteria bacterium]|nr:PilW family protein [Gammaproteobacteria bacterium]